MPRGASENQDLEAREPESSEIVVVHTSVSGVDLGGSTTRKIG